MVFDDDTTQPIWRPIPPGRQPAQPPDPLSAQIAEENPRWGPHRVAAERRRRTGKAQTCPRS
jgi:hypothetical protein